MSSSQRREIEELAASLRLAVGRLARRLRQQSLHGLTPSQLSILATLDREGPVRMGELARIENIAKPTITGIVDRLEDKQMLYRAPDPDDARSTVVAISDVGLKAIEAIRRERTAFLVARIEELQPQERDILRSATGVLSKMVAE